MKKKVRKTRRRLILTREVLGLKTASELCKELGIEKHKLILLQKCSAMPKGGTRCGARVYFNKFEFEAAIRTYKELCTPFGLDN